MSATKPHRKIVEAKLFDYAIVVLRDGTTLSPPVTKAKRAVMAVVLDWVAEAKKAKPTVPGDEEWGPM